MIFFSGCCGCEDERLPDLLSNEQIKEALISVSDNESIYDQSLIYLNAAAKINKVFCSGEKCNKTEIAGEHSNRLSIYYSQSNPNPVNWGQAQASAEVDKPSISPCDSKQTGGRMDFLRKGYYLVEILLDVSNKVRERSKSNNDIRDDFLPARIPFSLTEEQKIKKWGNNRYTKIVHILKSKSDSGQVVKILNVY